MIKFPTFYMIIGIPGSGKTYFCKNSSDSILHISSDSIRKELYGDESIQGDSNHVFHIMQERTLNALPEGKSVFYDATNIKRKNRISILEKLPSYVKKEAIIVWAPIETCIERDETRQRSVGKEVIHKMLMNYEAPYFDEGFDYIHLNRNVDMWDTKEIQYIKNNLHKDMNQDNPHHTLSLQDHMCKTEEYIKTKILDSELSLAARWHDVGKLYVKSFKNNKGETTDTAHYYGHQGYSAWISYGFSPITNNIAWLISNHMEPYFNSKYYNRLPEFLKKQLDLLHEADVAAH